MSPPPAPIQRARGRVVAGLLLRDGSTRLARHCQSGCWKGARDGRPVAELMETAAHVVTRAQCMEGIPEMIHDIQVEATFPDGTKLVTVHQPIR